MMEAYKETYTHYTTPNKNIQIVVYRKKTETNIITEDQKGLEYAHGKRTL